MAAALVALKLGVGLGTRQPRPGLGGDRVQRGRRGGGADGVRRAARRQAGRQGHPYGHRRAENLGALGEAAILLAGGVAVTLEGLRHLIAGGSSPDVRWFQFAILGVAIALDVSRTYGLAAGVPAASTARPCSPTRWHFGADLAGSVAVWRGCWPSSGAGTTGDAVAALVVAAIMLAASARLARVNANVLMDRAPVEARAAAEAGDRRTG